ncbi:hypothetical protein G7070_15780 [Propioniciclava coleopterorum]|uniref:tRNA-processing RNAse BN n=1 Tax=Propioniciclava coleopterorum TaxID=2714937 RepID=A0A6G7Y9I2_9ACTN|nr:YhjD/YihY/BrkB family envelope integrity protein [Propioniciclava coleopterorum]QIK73453.1 hypothetical protein G7070_15780 [Propioniciclava coleopterorum]
MVERLQRLLQIPWIAHLVRTFERFGQRLGSQFAAAITYFSVLSLVPILMVAFAILGLTLTVFIPDVLDQVSAWIKDAVAGQGELGEQLAEVVNQALQGWRAILGVGLVVALWSGANWVNNIRQAVHAQMRPVFDMTEQKTNIVVQTLINIGILLGLFLLVGVMMALSTVATGARDAVVAWLKLEGTIWAGLLAWAPLLGMLLAGYVLFVFMFAVFTERGFPKRLIAKGAVIGAVGTTILLWAAGFVVGIFSNNAAAAVFGSVIIVMLYFNLFATLTLIVAAWIATDTSQLVAEPEIVLTDDAARTPSNYASKELVAILRAGEERARQDRVPREAAVTAARVSGGVGAAVGAAVVGVMATIAAVVSGLLARRS